MPTCVPIKDMKDTSAFLKLVEASPEPVIVTKNGYDVLVVMRSSDYDRWKQTEATRKLNEIIEECRYQSEHGMYRDGEEAMAELRAKHGC